jgi:integrase/recombinase XerC
MFNLKKHISMNVTINAVNFEMAKPLEDFIEKKMNRFARHLNAEDKVEIRMSVIKPQTNANKEVKIRIAGLFAEKVADTFEEGIDACLSALESQLEKRKNN